MPDWGIPPDAQIGPQTPKARLNTINSQPTAINANQSFPMGSTGNAFLKAGAEAGNAEMGAEFVNRLVRGMQTPTNTAAGFIDKTGKVIDIGNQSHEGYLITKGMTSPQDLSSKLSTFAQSIKDRGLIRFRNMPGEQTAIELAHNPTPAQLTSLQSLVDKGKNVFADIWAPGGAQHTAAEDMNGGTLFNKIKRLFGEPTTAGKK